MTDYKIFLDNQDYNITRMPTSNLPILAALVLKYGSPYYSKFIHLVNIDIEIRKRKWYRRLFKKKWWYDNQAV